MAFPQPASQTAAPLEALAGTVERVTYHNADNGFAVLKVQTRASAISSPSSGTPPR